MKLAFIAAAIAITITSTVIAYIIGETRGHAAARLPSAHADLLYRAATLLRRQLTDGPEPAATRQWLADFDTETAADPL